MWRSHSITAKLHTSWADVSLKQKNSLEQKNRKLQIGCDTGSRTTCDRGHITTSDVGHSQNSQGQPRGGTSPKGFRQAGLKWDTAKGTAQYRRMWKDLNEELV